MAPGGSFQQVLIAGLFIGLLLTAPALNPVVLREAKKIRDLPYEVVWGFIGNVPVIHAIGTVTYVNFTGGQNLEGGLTVHNHPLQGNGFSREDITTSRKYGLKEMWVVTNRTISIMYYPFEGNYSVINWTEIQ